MPKTQQVSRLFLKNSGKLTSQQIKPIYTLKQNNCLGVTGNDSPNLASIFAIFFAPVYSRHFMALNLAVNTSRVIAPVSINPI